MQFGTFREVGTDRQHGKVEEARVERGPLPSNTSLLKGRQVEKRGVHVGVDEVEGQKFVVEGGNERFERDDLW